MTTTAWLALLLTAQAHHDVAVSQVPTATLPEVRTADAAAPSRRLQLGVSHDLVLLGRLQRGAATYDADARRSLSVHTLTPSLGVRWPTRTSLQVALPVGLVHGRLDEQARTSGGVGDLRLELGQGFTSRPDAVRAWTVTARATVSAPTGRYEPDPAMQLTDVAAGQDGALLITTYDLRASLGAGAWGLGAGLRAGGPIGPVELTASGDLLQPVGQTPDRVRWGSTLDARLELSGALANDRLALGAGVEGRWHLADRWQVADEDSDSTTVALSGRRSAAALSASLSGRVSEGVRCGLRVRVPVWQQVQGIQLVETVASSVGCQFAVGI